MVPMVSGQPTSTMEALVEAIDVRLPQTQCQQCGYPGCRPYAEAIARGEAINRCPPGGKDTIEALAKLLNRSVLQPQDPAAFAKPSRVAVIREEACIGCTKCIQACPVDAILGAARRMHTVIASECTGCELCLAPCPVDCIDLVPLPGPSPDRRRRRQLADHYRRRYLARNARLARERVKREADRRTRLAILAERQNSPGEKDAKRRARAAAVKAAVERKRAQQAARGRPNVSQETLNENLRQAGGKNPPRGRHSGPGRNNGNA